jgi:hypothetical protein
MRTLIGVALVAIVAGPAFASGHGHATYKAASETMPKGPKTKTDQIKTFREKRTRYEKELKATERESDQVKVYKIKGLTHPPVEAADLKGSGKGSRVADTRPAPAPKITKNGVAAVGAPSARGAANGSSGGGSAH